MGQVHIQGRPLNGHSGHEAGMALLQALFLQVTGREMPPIVVSPGGKPDFENAAWHFSITHTRTHVFCALAQCPVGIDAEDLDRRVDLKLADRILSAAEYAQYARAPQKQKALLTFWVLKEAAAKCSGRGIQYPENRTEFSLEDERVWEEDGCIAAVITEEDHAI